MKTIYVVTSKYMPLIEKEDLAHPSERAYKNRRIIHTQDITQDIIEETFTKSKNRMLAFNTKEEAAIAMTLGLKTNNTTPEYIDGEIPFFAVPVVFAAQVEDNVNIDESKNLSGLTIYNYFETDSIPFFSSAGEQGFWKDSIIKGIDDKIGQLDSCPKAFSIEKKDIQNKVSASYLAANPVREANINLANAIEDLSNIKSQENKSIQTPGCALF